MGLLKDWAKSRKLSDPVPGTLRVTACTVPDSSATSANYNLDGVVTAEGVLPTVVNHSGIAKARKWPSAGRELPITLDRADPTTFRIEWDQVQTGDELGAASAARLAASMRGGVPADGAPATGDLAALVGQAQTTTLPSQVIDLRGTGAREQIIAAMGDPAKMQEAIMDSLAQAGIQMPQPGAGTGFPQPAVEAHDDPATRLRKLDALKAQGLVHEDEYARVRAQILEDV
jgi:hypothetical protein